MFKGKLKEMEAAFQEMQRQGVTPRRLSFTIGTAVLPALSVLSVPLARPALTCAEPPLPTGLLFRKHSFHGFSVCAILVFAGLDRKTNSHGNI